MRPFRLLALAAALATAACAAPAVVAPAHAEVGAEAPDFTLTALDGTSHTLSAQRGKTVVLEWYNPDCPFVKHAHTEGGSLHGLGDRAVGDGVVWWAINSGAPGEQGTGKEHNAASVATYGFGYPLLLDESGEVGRKYGAITTPHMFIIGPDGRILYEGAIDNAPLGDAKGKAKVNYVEQALAELAAGGPVRTPVTRPYGCSVKYK